MRLLWYFCVKCQYASLAVYAYAHDFQKQPGCALIGACALIRTNTVYGINIKLRFFKSSEYINEKRAGPYRGFGY